MKSFFTTKVFFSTTLPVLLFFGFVGFVSGNFVEPTSNPPQGNVAAPITTSSQAQTKSGNLWVDNLISRKLTALSELCIGNECRTAWSVGGDEFSTVCTVNRRIVANFDSSGIPHTSRVSTPLSELGRSCPSRISNSERDTWMLVGFDNCPSVKSRDCAGPGYCQYIQIQCDNGITTRTGRFR